MLKDIRNILSRRRKILDKPIVRLEEVIMIMRDLTKKDIPIHSAFLRNTQTKCWLRNAPAEKVAEELIMWFLAYPDYYFRGNHEIWKRGLSGRNYIQMESGRKDFRGRLLPQCVGTIVYYTRPKKTNEYTNI